MHSNGGQSLSGLGRPRSDPWQHVNVLRGEGIFLDEAKGLSESRRVGGSREEIIKNFIEKSMKNYNFMPFFHNFNENFAIFTKFSKDFSNFSRKFGRNLEVWICRGFRLPGGSDAEENSKIFIKNQWKITILGQFFIILMKILEKMYRIFGENLGKFRSMHF